MSKNAAEMLALSDQDLLATFETAVDNADRRAASFFVKNVSLKLAMPLTEEERQAFAPLSSSTLQSFWDDGDCADKFRNDHMAQELLRKNASVILLIGNSHVLPLLKRLKRGC